jgi:uncharacterized protein YvpB
MKSGNLNFLEPSGALQACNGTAVPFVQGLRGTNTKKIFRNNQVVRSQNKNKNSGFMGKNRGMQGTENSLCSLPKVIHPPYGLPTQERGVCILNYITIKI